MVKRAFGERCDHDRSTADAFGLLQPVCAGAAKLLSARGQSCRRRRALRGIPAGRSSCRYAQRVLRGPRHLRTAEGVRAGSAGPQRAAVAHSLRVTRPSAHPALLQFADDALHDAGDLLGIDRFTRRAAAHGFFRETFRRQQTLQFPAQLLQLQLLHG